MAQDRPPSQTGRYQPVQLLHGYQETGSVARRLRERDGKIVSEETAGPVEDEQLYTLDPGVLAAQIRAWAKQRGYKLRLFQRAGEALEDEAGPRCQALRPGSSTASRAVTAWALVRWSR
jgi:hypothetical protein